MERPSATTSRSGRDLARTFLVVLGATVSIQWVAASTLGLPRLPAEARSTLAALERSGAPVLYFGDSTLRYDHARVPDELTLPSLLEGRLGRKVIAIDHPAYHAGVFLDWVRYLQRTGLMPGTVVVPVNARSFGERWRTDPAYAFESLRLALRHRGTPLQPWTRALRVFSVGPPLGVASGWGAGEERSRSEPSVRELFVDAYATPLRDDDPRLEELTLLARRLERGGCRALFYATPVDWESAEEHGLDVRPVLEADMALVERRVRGAGARWRDWSLALGKGSFTWLRYPSEHLDEAGRRWLAGQIAEALPP